MLCRNIVGQQEGKKVKIIIPLESLTSPYIVFLLAINETD